MSTSFFVLAQSSLSRILAEFVGWIRVMGTGLYLPLIIKASSDLSAHFLWGKFLPEGLSVNTFSKWASAG